jgi:predicted TIM-barrel fold metal-dependent hydrolase
MSISASIDQPPDNWSVRTGEPEMSLATNRQRVGEDWIARLPDIVSVDDHVLEPPDLWVERLPAKYRDRAPRVERYKGRIEVHRDTRLHQVIEDEAGEWGDAWIFEDLRWAMVPPFAAAGIEGDNRGHRPLTYDEVRPGCFRQAERLSDMVINRVSASLCFPTFPRFCGQTFLERGPRDLALACVQVYNDWMIDEWCAGDGYGRLIPQTIIPLWDVELAVAEVQRCAAKGSHAIAFSEGPVALGLPSLYSGNWDPLWAACEDSNTVVNMHIGSSSKVATTGPDSPNLVPMALIFQGSMHCAVDWLVSGVFERYPGLRIALSEGQVGWLPYLLQRLDSSWENFRATAEIGDRLKKPPSAYYVDHIFGCIFDDAVGLLQRDVIGVDQIMFESDYPHGDSTWPRSHDVAEKLVADVGLNEVEATKLLRGNAIRLYGLSRFGIDA